MSEMWSTEGVLKKHGLWRELAGPAAGPTAIKLQWQDMRIDQLNKELSLAEEGLANYAQENAQLREFISSFQELLDLDPENHPGTDLGRLMLEVTEYLRHQPQIGGA